VWRSLWFSVKSVTGLELYQETRFLRGYFGEEVGKLPHGASCRCLRFWQLANTRFWQISASLGESSIGWEGKENVVCLATYYLFVLSSLSSFSFLFFSFFLFLCFLIWALFLFLFSFFSQLVHLLTRFPSFLQSIASFIKLTIRRSVTHSLTRSPGA